MEHREVEPPIQLSVFTGGLNSKLSIQLNFSCSSAMVLTAYPCMVVGQKAIEAKECAWLRQHSATTDIALVNGHLVIRFDFKLRPRDYCRCGVVRHFCLSPHSCLPEP